MDLPDGVHRTKAGHLRYSSPSSKRGKYIHREMIETLIAETHPLTLATLQYPYEVHHMDYNKEHNCGANLLMLSNAVHSALTAHGRTGSRGKFRPKWLPPPAWALDFGDEEIPF